MNSLSINSLAEFITEYLKNKGFFEWKPVGVISPRFPDNFNPSATHTQISEIINKKIKMSPGDFFVIEPCIRYQDIDLVGFSFHLAFFEMVGIVSFNKKRRKEIIQIFCDLMSHLNIPLERIYVTIFGGGQVKSQLFDKDTETFEAWIEMGVQPDRIIESKGSLNFLFPGLDNDVAGPRSEVFYSLDDILLNNNNLIEIATFEFSQGLTMGKGERNMIVKWNNEMVACYFGLERIALAINNKHDIGDIFEIAQLINILKTKISNPLKIKIFKKELIAICNLTAAITFIISEGQNIDGSTRARRLKDMVKKCINLIDNIFSKEMRESILQELISKIFDIYNQRYSTIKKDAVINVLNKLF